jgi:hypothetical protein
VNPVLSAKWAVVSLAIATETMLCVLVWVAPCHHDIDELLWVWDAV